MAEYKFYCEGACSSCQTLVAFTMEWMKAIDEYDKNKGISIVAGRIKELPKVADPKNLILVGDCTKKFKGQGVFGGGCPPIEVIPLFPILQRRSMESMTDVLGTEDPEELMKMRAELRVKQDKFVEYAKRERDKFAAKTGRNKKK